MQRYQVFIDDHFIFFSESLKSNQQQDTIFELINPDADDINFIIGWLSREKESSIAVGLISDKPEKLWKLFQAQFKLIEAAGGLVRNEKDEILFIYRLGKWDLPKGKMENDESPLESALREVEEECGISDLQAGDPLPDTYHVYFHKGKFVLKRTYWFKMTYLGNRQLIPQTEEAIEKAVWIQPSEIGNQLLNTYASLKPIIATI